MSSVLVILAALLLAALFAGTLVVFPALWLGLRDQWRRIPEDRRGPALAGAVLSAAYVFGGATLAIVAPWGRSSIAYVIGVGGGSLMLLCMAAVGVAAVRESRVADRRRKSRH